MERNRNSKVTADERELQFDVRRLEAGDAVEVFVETEQRWIQGTFAITAEGEALIELPARSFLLFADARSMGLKRILH